MYSLIKLYIQKQLRCSIIANNGMDNDGDGDDGDDETNNDNSNYKYERVCMETIGQAILYIDLISFNHA